MTPSQQPPVGRNDRALAGLRIAVSVFFLIFGSYKVFWSGFTLGGGFQRWINGFLSNGEAYPFMVPVLRGFVLWHGTAIAFLVAYGELAIGVSLTLGLLTSAASVCGFVYMLTLLFAANYPGPGSAPWHYFGASLSHSVFACCFAAFALGQPERAWSVRRRNRPRASTPSRVSDA